MPTIIIKQGNRTLKFTKRERDTLDRAKTICDDLVRDYAPLSDQAESASEGLAIIIEVADAKVRKTAPAAV